MVESTPKPDIPFTHPPAVEEWNVPYKQWLLAHDKHWDGVIAGAFVFHPVTGRVLLIQRASHDTMPNRYETPGGAVDGDDPSILYAAARELFEEAGLKATAIKRHVPYFNHEGVPEYDILANRSGTRFWCRFSFEFEVESAEAVVLDPNEHQAYYWATEEEVRAQKMEDGKELPITHPTMKMLILGAFASRKVDAAA